MPASPGARLAAYREERGWTVEQVASQLNLAPRQIVALESDDYPSLPGMPIVRGFIRAYAKLLKVDAAPLLAGAGGETMLAHPSIAPMNSLATPFSETRLPTMVDRPGLSSKWVIGLLLVVLVAVALWAARRTGGFASLPHTSHTAVSPVTLGSSAAPAPEVQPSSAPTGQPATAGAPPAMNEEAPAASAASPALSPSNNASLPPPTSAGAEEKAAAVKSAGESAVSADRTGKAVVASNDAAPAADNALVLKAQQETWVEVRQVQDNKVLLSRIMKPGESEQVSVEQPVSVVIGNAAGAEASLRGKPLDVKAHAKVNVARLTLK